MKSVWTEQETLEALHELEVRRRKDSFDPSNPGSKPTKAQSKFLNDIGKPGAKFRIAKSGNQSGKSTTCGWELAKVITETHPWWTRPVEWGEGPIKAIVAGQDRTMMELEIWEGKLLPHFKREEWHISRSGSQLNHVTHLPTGNQIIFLSHSDGSDKARRHMQGYVVHYLWIDEMPINARIWEELEKRIVSKNGYLVASFTSKVRSESIRQIVDNHGKQDYCTVYSFSMLDNPVLKSRADEILAQMMGYPESYRNAVLYGDWYTGDSAVYMWDSAMIEELPDTYSNSWRHLEAVDPAMQSKMGHLLLAEEPNTGKWFMISSSYIEHLSSPKEYVEAALKKSATRNVKFRVSDVAPWFTQTAAIDYGINYTNPHKKTERKDELIKGLQHALSSGKLRITPRCKEFIDEISSCQWSEGAAGKIVNGQAYHCLDAATYAVDCFPTWDGPVQLHEDYHTNLKMKHRKQQEEKAANASEMMKISRRQRSPEFWARGRRNYYR